MFTTRRILFEALEAHFCGVSGCVWVRLLSILANIITRRAAQSTHSSDAIPTRRTLELLAFDEKSTFDYFCFIWAYGASPALYAQIKQKIIKSGFFIES
jgi:hypothetical protein